MSDLFGNHLVGFPTRWLIFNLIKGKFSVFQELKKSGLTLVTFPEHAQKTVKNRIQVDRQQ